MLFPLGMYTVAVSVAQGNRFGFPVSYFTLLLVYRCVRMVGDVRRVCAQRAARPAPPTRGATLRSHFTKQRLCQAPEML